MTLLADRTERAGIVVGPTRLRLRHGRVPDESCPGGCHHYLLGDRDAMRPCRATALRHRRISNGSDYEAACGLWLGQADRFVAESRRLWSEGSATAESLPRGAARKNAEKGQKQPRNAHRTTVFSRPANFGTGQRCREAGVANPYGTSKECLRALWPSSREGEP